MGGIIIQGLPSNTYSTLPAVQGIKNHTVNYYLIFKQIFTLIQGCAAGTVVKNPPVNVGNMVSAPGLGRSPGEGNGFSLQYSCLENPMDRGAWWATVHGVAKSQTQLSTSILPYSFEKINTSTKIFILVSNKELFKMANMTYSD